MFYTVNYDVTNDKLGSSAAKGRENVGKFHTAWRGSHCVRHEHLLYQAKVSPRHYPLCHTEYSTTLRVVFRHAQVPGLAPPGVVIPQLGSALRAGAPGPPGVVIPQLASKLCLGTCESFFLRLNRISNRIGRPIRFRMEFSNRIGRIYQRIFNPFHRYLFCVCHERD